MTSKMEFVLVDLRAQVFGSTGRIQPYPSYVLPTVVDTRPAQHCTQTIYAYDVETRTVQYCTYVLWRNLDRGCKRSTLGVLLATCATVSRVTCALENKHSSTTITQYARVQIRFHSNTAASTQRHRDYHIQYSYPSRVSSTTSWTWQYLFYIILFDSATCNVFVLSRVKQITLYGEDAIDTGYNQYHGTCTTGYRYR